MTATCNHEQSRNLNKVWVCLMYNKSDVDSPKPVGAAATPSLLFSYRGSVLSAGPGQLPRLQGGGGSTEEDFVPALKVPSGCPACPSCLRTIGWTESMWGTLRMCCSDCVTKRNLIFKEKGMWVLTVSPPSLLHSGIGRVWKDASFEPSQAGTGCLSTDTLQSSLPFFIETLQVFC